MPTDAGTAFVTVLPNTAGFSTALQGGIQKQSSGFLSSAKSIGKTLGLTLGAGLAVGFASSSFKAFEESEAVMAQFNSTLGMMPKLAGETSSAFEDQAHALQNLTGYQDEAIIGADTILARFNLTADQIQGAIPIVLDFARATGRDVPAAAQAIGKALLGNSRALKDVGIEYTRTGDAGKDFSNILDLMTSKVGGSAEAFGETLAGKIDIAKAKLDDFKESVGQFLGSGLLLLTGDLEGAAQAWVEVGDAIPIDTMNHFIQVLGVLSPAQVAARTEMQHTTAAANDEAAAHRGASAAILAHRTAELSLAGGLVGVQAAASQLHDAQAALNVLEAQGKTGTQAYTQAQTAAFQAFMSLNGAVQAYEAGTRGATGATDQGRGALALMAQSLGIAQGNLAAYLGTTNAALSKQLAFNAALNNMPHDVYVTVHTNYVETGSQPHGGIQ